MNVDPDQLLTPAERALRDARDAADNFDYGDQYATAVEGVPVARGLDKADGEKAHYFNRTTGATGWEAGDVLPAPVEVLVVQLSTEEGGREKGIVESDFATELLHLDTFDRSYPYNRRKVRREMMAALPQQLRLTETGQREGGRAGGQRCIRFRGDVREAVRDWLVTEGMVVDWPWTCVDADGFAVRDEKRPAGPHRPGGLSTTQGPRLRSAVGADSLDSLLLSSRGGGGTAGSLGRASSTARSMGTAASARSVRTPATSEMPLAEAAAAAAAMPVATCVLSEHPAVRRWLQARVDADGGRRVRAMLKACRAGNSTEVRRLLMVSDKEKDCSLADGVTPLMTVALKRYRDEKTRLELWQPLSNEYLDVANELLKKRADPNRQTPVDGYTALFHAVSNNQAVLAISLLQQGADPNVKTRLGYTALTEAAAMNFCELVRRLIAYGAEMNSVDADGCTAMMHGARRGQADVVKLLISYGANRVYCDKFGNTARSLAKQAGHMDVHELLST